MSTMSDRKTCTYYAQKVDDGNKIFKARYRVEPSANATGTVFTVTLLPPEQGEPFEISVLEALPDAWTGLYRALNEKHPGWVADWDDE